MKKNGFYRFSLIYLGILTAITLFPLVLLAAGSFTDESVLIRDGYTLLPAKFSLEAYAYIFRKFSLVGRAYLVTVATTVIGTVLSLVLSASLAYPMSRSGFKYRNTLSFFVYFTMLFNGGIVPSYILWTNYINIKNTYAALVVPHLLMSAFNVLLIRNYYKNSIPEALYEAAQMDGATEFVIFSRITLPMSVPVLSTVGLFCALSYWNSWTNAMYYVTDPKYYGIQNLLMRIMKNIEYLKSAIESGEEVVMTLPGQSIRMALALIGILPVMILYPFVQKYFINGIIVGAVKG